MTERSEKQIRFPVQQRADNEPTQFVNTWCEILVRVRNYCQIQSCHGNASRCAKTNSDSVDLHFLNLNVPP